MMKTATDFSMQVKKCEKAIRAAHGANAELLTTTKAVMTLPLPQVRGGARSLRRIRSMPCWGVLPLQMPSDRISAAADFRGGP